MEDRPWAKYWISHFKKDPIYGTKRFKTLKAYQGSIQIDPDIVDYVSEEEFVKVEQDRIPLGVGSQFGIYPTIVYKPDSVFFNGEKVVALIFKSLLSGHVDGLHLFHIGKDEKTFLRRKIRYFPNQKIG
jgi:hypothetical protein